MSGSPTTEVQRRILDRLAAGPATLAQLRGALPADHPHRVALMSMGESDPFGEELTALIGAGRVEDAEGRYRASPSAG